MNTLRSSATLLSRLMFTILLILLVPVSALVLTLSNEALIKDQLRDSGAYQEIVTATLAQKLQENSDTLSPQLREAITEALDKDFTERAGDQVTDGLYGWLKGETPQPEFTIDLTEAKQSFTAKIAQTIQQKLTELPPCTLQQLRSMGGAIPSDPTQLKCLPPGINIDAASQEYAALIAADPAIPDQLKAQTLLQTSGVSTFEQLSYIPAAYQGAKPLIWVIAVAVVIFGVLAIGLQRNRWRAVKTLGLILIGSAIITGLLLAILTNAAHQFTDGDNQSILGPAVEMLSGIVLTGVQAVYVWFIGVYGILGGIMFALGQWKNRTKARETNKSTQ